jgi:urease accessory protein
LVHLHNVSGGIVGGDGLSFEVAVGQRAQAQITAIGATRIYRCKRASWPASQTTKLTIEKDALLEFLPDIVIPFKGSRFSQKTEVYLQDGGGLIWWETLSAGRISSGEVFAFDELALDASIYSKETPIAFERYSLCPSRSDLSSPARFGKYFYSTTMYICRVDEERGKWRALEDELNLLGMELTESGAKWGASSLIKDGVVVRGMARTAQEVSEGLWKMWKTGKERIWGRPALLPRKIY